MNIPRLHMSDQKGGKSPKNAMMPTHRKTLEKCGGGKSPIKSQVQRKYRGGKSPIKSQVQRKHGGGKSKYKPKCADTGNPYKLNEYGISLIEHYKSACPKTNSPSHKYLAKDNKKLGNDQLRFDGDTCDYLDEIPQLEASRIGHLNCAQARQRFRNECAKKSDSGHNYRIILNKKAAEKCKVKIAKKVKPLNTNAAEFVPGSYNPVVGVPTKGGFQFWYS